MDVAFLADTMGQLLAVTPLTVELWFFSILIGGILALFVCWARVRACRW